MHAVILHQHQSIRGVRAILQIDVWSTQQKQYQVIWSDGIKIFL